MLSKLKSFLKRKKNRSIEEYDIDENELEKILKRGAILVDVRSPQEYEYNCILFKWNKK